MAQRRMFSLKVIDTDSFLDMSPTAQNLYFHLGMRADDDGFVSNPKKIMKISGAPDDDMKVLIAKGFVIKMATNGVIVITHWKVNNLIRPDRYTETEYKEEKSRLDCVDNKYCFLFGAGNKTLGIPNVIPNGNQSVSQVRLGKDRSDKSIALFENFWNAYPRKTGKKKAEQSWNRLNPKPALVELIMKALENHKGSEQWSKDKGIFIPYPATWLNQERWNDEVIKALPPKKKPYFNGMPIVEKFGKRYCIKNGEMLEFAGKESQIEYK